jgi:ribosomal protein S18 acetylase RimI-like enzyme
MDEPLPARGAPLDELTELVQLVRRELLLREEGPTGAWVESTAGELRAGTKAGYYVPIVRGGALAFRSDRGTDAFAHVHVAGASEPATGAVRLTERLVADLPASIRSLSVGFTGLTTEEERDALHRLSGVPGSTIIRRFAMERPVGPSDGGPLAPPPEGLEHVRLRDVTLEALADLDARAFAGTVDALLIGADLEEYRRVLRALLAGEAGRFLEEASTALYRPDPPALLGALVTCEKSARRAAFLDFMVDPSARRRGYGRYLLIWGFRALRALGYERVRLWVSETNAPARALYASLGFTTTHETVIYRWDRSGESGHPQTAA